MSSIVLVANFPSVLEVVHSSVLVELSLVTAIAVLLKALARKFVMVLLCHTNALGFYQRRDNGHYQYLGYKNELSVNDIVLPSSVTH